MFCFCEIASIELLLNSCSYIHIIAVNLAFAGSVGMNSMFSLVSYEKDHFLNRTKLNMLFIPTLPVKAEYTAMLRMLSNAKNAWKY